MPDWFQVIGAVVFFTMLPALIWRDKQRGNFAR